MLAVFDQDGNVVSVDPVGLGFANALSDLACSLNGIEDGHLVVVADQEVVEAVPVVAGGLHGNRDLPRPADLLQPIENALIALGIVVERLRADDKAAFAVDDAGYVPVLADVDPAEAGLLSRCRRYNHGQSFPSLIGCPCACSARNLIRDTKRSRRVGTFNQLIRGRLNKARAQRSFPRGRTSRGHTLPLP